MSLYPNNDYFNFNIIGIDPGLNNVGISIYNLNEKLEINSITAYTLIIDKLIDNTNLDNELSSDKIIKMYKLKVHLSKIFQLYNPILVVCESPFYSSFRPTAYASLLQAINIIQTSIIDYNYNIVFKLLEPLLVKKIIGAGMQTGKLDVKQAISSNNEIMTKLNVNLNLLDEHSVDAIAIGYSYIKLSRS